MKVLLVEDSLTVRVYVEGVLRAAPDVELLPSARDGKQGVELAIAHRPDVIVMDLELPVLSGLEAIREIMATAPCPIVVLSGELDKPGEDRTFESFRAGAVDVLGKPQGLSAEERVRFGERLLRIVRVMSEARVLRRRPQTSRPTPLPSLAQVDEFGACDVVLIGASTGGPLIIRSLLDAIPAPYPLPIVICQHIVAGFEGGLASWLGESGHRVSVVSPSDRLEPGVVFVARADCHLSLRGRAIKLVTQEAASRTMQGVRPPLSRPTPSVDVLFDSAASSFGARCMAILLSGMGDDGMRGLLALRRAGAFTVTQTADTCVIDGMPGAARAAGAGKRDLSPPQMVELLRRLAASKQIDVVEQRSQWADKLRG